ncbi:MAG: 4Fe-4S binding protein [Tannerella sp.]|nr:4Fe-4S binding protein [Tannerella sp.]
MPLVISKKLCPQNHPCPLLRVCPAGAITQTGYALPQIDPEKCIECGKCVKHCGMRAVYTQNT